MTHRNGARERLLSTKAGDLELQVLRDELAAVADVGRSVDPGHRATESVCVVINPSPSPS